MIHILFCSSAAGTLRQVLNSRHRRERVVDLVEHLDWGPICTADLKQRSGWFDQNIPSALSGGWDWIVEHFEDFAHGAESDADRLIWVEANSARELSGLHWFLDRFGSSDDRILVAPRHESRCGLGVRNTESMADLLDNWPRAHWNKALFPESLWATLSAEKSLLRVVEGGSLQSVPSDYFDDYLLDRCSTAWVEWIRVIANAMTDIVNAGHDVDDLFLRWRLGDLIQRGALVSQGELPRYGGQSIALVRLAS